MSEQHPDSKAKRINNQIILWTTLIGGFISSLVKWGSEVNMPPRMLGEISPPGPTSMRGWDGWASIPIRSITSIKG